MPTSMLMSCGERQDNIMSNVENFFNVTDIEQSSR